MKTLDNQIIRIQKYMADRGVSSRRGAEDIVRQGRVLINGSPAVIGSKVTPGRDIVKVDGVELSDRTAKNCYIIMNKPRGYVTTMNDEMGRKCVADLISDVKDRVFPVGRLDRESEGLLLLTNDGTLAYKLTHPKHGIAKSYKVVVGGHPSQEQINALSAPMVLDGYETSKSSIKLLSEEDDRTVLGITIYEGRNRQIRKMCEEVNINVMRLKRERIGDLRLGGLKPGKWRYLESPEIETLKKL